MTTDVIKDLRKAYRITISKSNACGVQLKKIAEWGFPLRKKYKSKEKQQKKCLSIIYIEDILFEYFVHSSVQLSLQVTLKMFQHQFAKEDLFTCFGFTISFFVTFLLLF